MKILEERVLLLMEEKGITQRQMAKDLSFSATTLNGYLHGKYLHVPDDVIHQIASYLEVSASYITDRSALLETENCKLTKAEVLFLDDYRHLNSSDKKKVAAITTQLLNHSHRD
jgi:transcriptional regulator with XRE-family HTH domain